MAFVHTMEDEIMRVAPAILLNPEQKTALERLARARSEPARVVERAQIVLLAAAGLENKQIARRMDIMPETAARWRGRFLEGGIAALHKDAPRPGKPRTITDREVKRVVEMTLHQKPVNATHWSTRTMAQAAGISEASVRRIWRAHGLKPHRVRTFKLSNHPEFVEKLEDIVGPVSEPAIVLYADEEEPDSGSGPHPTGPGDEEGPLQHHDPRLQAQQHGHAVRCSGCAGGRSDLHVRRPVPPSGVVEVSARHRRHRPAQKADPHDRGQLRHPQASQGRALARSPSPLSHALHAHRLLLAEHGGTILPRPDRKSLASRSLSQCRGVDHRHLRLHRPSQ